MRRLSIQLLTVFVSLILASLATAQTVPGWPAEVSRIQYLSQPDNTQQPALFYAPGNAAADNATDRPLLVALHSWSGDYTQANPAYALWCIAKGWVMIHPNFRGINDHPEACGSDLAVADVVSAVEYAKTHARIDATRVYLIGASGGGYGSLLLAGRHPEIWAGVSAWCPIYDLRAWHGETQQRKLRYSGMLEKVCGGKPGTSVEVDQQYKHRSASTWLSAASKVTLSINTGITDGHNGSVPIGHTLRAFNSVAASGDAISEAIIERMQTAPKMPPDLLQTISDPLYVRKPVLFRKQSNNCQVTIFQGGHDIIYEAGLAWLERQQKGQPAVWIIDRLPDVDLTKLDTASGK